jgi:MYXO-CTERM domain-containing protein
MKSERRAFVRRPRLSALAIALSALAGGGAIAACSSSDPPKLQAGAGSSSVGPESVADLASRLVAPHPWLAAALTPNALAWTSEGERFVSPGWRAVDARDPDGVGAEWPTVADGAIRVGVGRDPTRTIVLTAAGASHAAASLDRGRVVFRDAYPSTDVVVGSTRERVEELLVLKDATAPSTFAWSLSLPSRIPSGRIAENGALVLTDAHGKAALLVPRPFAVDAAGVKRDANLAFDGATLQIALDTTGLTFPVALDPAVETPLWTMLSTATEPTPYRDAPEFAFDTTHHVSVLFGGQSTLSDTWLFNAATSTWSQSCTTCGPPARSYGAMAFDTARGVAVMFGGAEAGVRQNDVWEWNGSSWSQVCTGTCLTSGPSARNQASMAYSGASGVLLFGGVSSAGNQQDTWTWSGTAWTQRCTSGCTPPSARFLTALAYDSGSGKVVLFGGTIGGTSGQQNDTWEWTGATWAQVCTGTCQSSGPSVRTHHSMAYDSARSKTVLFGGADSNGNSLDDVWEWNGTAWTNTEPNSATSPGARYDAAFAFDTTNRECVLFSGNTAASTTDTWVYTTHGEACTTGSTCDSNVCTDGVCCEAACTNECYPCDGTAPGVSPGVCATTGAVNAQTTGCTGTSYCNGSSQCIAKVANGGACVNDIACSSGICDTGEGLCCNAACNADGCHSCSAALNGGTAGQCLPITAGTAARSGCTATATSSCGLDGTCNGTGACRDWPGTTTCVNESCTGTTQTNSALCNGAGACNTPTTAACGTGFTCGATSCNTSCTVGSDAGCQAGFYCVGGTMCVSKLTNGMACTAGDQCAVGNCNHDSVCCDMACNGPCQSCTNATKGTGPDGTCGGTAANTADPSGTCTSSGTTCGAQPQCDGTFNGASSCVQHAHSGTVCGATTCIANEQSGQQCDGAGNCASANNEPCAPYECANTTACATTCAVDTDCQTGGYCSGAHTCIVQQSVGQMCGSAHECANGQCVDGYCCNSTCTDSCEACNVTGKLGTCSPVTGATVGSRQACTSAGMTPCGGTCNGTSPTCSYAGATTNCGNACDATHNNEQVPSSCNGQGACVAGTAVACPNNLICDPTSMLCKPSCASNADCAASYDCDSSTHLCVPMTGATCDGMHTVNTPMEEPQDCTPYNCTAMGCLTTCASPADCVSPNLCDSTNHCNPPPTSDSSPNGGSSGGCAASTDHASGQAGWFAILALGAVGARRRRRVRA